MISSNCDSFINSTELSLPNVYKYICSSLNYFSSVFKSIKIFLICIKRSKAESF